MPAMIDITEQQIFTAMRGFILSLIDCEVIQGLDNGTPMPKGGFIAMTVLFDNRLSTNINTYIDDEVQSVKNAMQPTQFTMQIDCYGAQAHEWAKIFTTMFRDEYACDRLAPTCQPLHADDPRQMAITNGEQQYEQRWLITALLQYNPTVTVDQEFFTSASPVAINADTTI